MTASVSTVNAAGSATGSTTTPTALGSYGVTAHLASANYAFSNSSDATLTIVNPPVIASSPATPLLSAFGAQVSFGVTPNGIATKAYFEFATNSSFNLDSTTETETVGSGKTPITVTGFLTGLTPSTLYYYRIVVLTSVGVEYGPTESFTTLGFETTLVAATGVAPGGGLPTFTTLEAGAVNAADGAAFRATISGLAAASNTGIYANVANGGALTLVAQTGSTAPGTSGAVFSALTDPVYIDTGDLAFGGTLKLATGTVTAANENGVWATDQGTLGLLAREGSPAPGTGGALFATFTGAGLCQFGGGIVAGTLTESTSLGVTALNNAGVWEGSTSNNLTLMLRTGETTSGTVKTIASFKLFPVETYVNGQTRAFGPTTGHLAVTATFTDKTSGIVEVLTAGAPAAVATVGEVAAGTSGATFATFGSPAIDDNDEVAFQATLKSGVGDATAANDAGLWTDYGGGTPALVARLGSIAPGTGTSATFLTFSDPVKNANAAVAFRATLSTGANAATATTNTGIWCNGTGALALVVRTGQPAPGCAPGVTISALTGLALDDTNGATHHGGVICLATLSGTGVTAADNTAIFAQDNNGTLQLIVRTGDVFEGKAITALTFLPAELSTGNAPVNGQERSFSGLTGDLVYNATFSDKSQAIFNVVFP